MDPGYVQGYICSFGWQTINTRTLDVEHLQRRPTSKLKNVMCQHIWDTILCSKSSRVSVYQNFAERSRRNSNPRSQPWKGRTAENSPIDPIQITERLWASVCQHTARSSTVAPSQKAGVHRMGIVACFYRTLSARCGSKTRRCNCRCKINEYPISWSMGKSRIHQQTTYRSHMPPETARQIPK